YDLDAGWPSAAAARRELGEMFGRNVDPGWGDVHDDAMLTRLATQGMGAHLLRPRQGAPGFEIDLPYLGPYPWPAPFARYAARRRLGPSVKPEAIERDGVTARPGDASWERFVLAFQSSLAAETTLIDHSLTAHFAMAGSLVLALRLHLPEGHPLRDVLTPFTF